MIGTKMLKNKVLALSSPGGHWVQLCRLIPAFKASDVIYACTYNKASELSDDDNYYIIGDISRDSIGRIFSVISGIVKILKKEKPTVIITTGALPGLIIILLGRLFGIKTIWLDSIANSEKISMSGKIASYLAHNCFTQWEILADKRIKYIGRVI
jgi:UDP-N-acetylglucosamine:LPS N-acetylglucosamine transferase